MISESKLAYVHFQSIMPTHILASKALNDWHERKEGEKCQLAAVDCVLKYLQTKYVDKGCVIDSVQYN